jgi:hypothetical protein
MKITQALSIFAIVLAGLCMTVGKASAQATTFATWETTTQYPDSTVTFTNTGATGSTSSFTTTAVPVNFYYQVPNGYSTGVGASSSVEAYMTITGTVDGAATTGAHTRLTQDFSSIQISITNANDTVNYLTAEASSPSSLDLPAASGRAGSLEAGSTSSNANGAPQTVTFSSDYLDFTNTSEDEFAFTLSNLYDSMTGNTTSTATAPTINANGYLDSFYGGGTGTFASTPPPLPKTPEPSPLLSLAIAAIGLGALLIVQKKRHSLTS